MPLTLKSIDLSQEFKDKDAYERRLVAAQLRMLLIQRWMYEHHREAILVFEGWDAAGKGGAIRRLVEKLDPRGFVVHPIGAPTAEDRGQHYLQRFWNRMPRPGSLGIFDRSWYGRVLVERVEKFAKKPEWKRAYREINAFERMLHDDGVPIVKCFLHISKKEQLERFHEREKDPFKNWKIGADDWRNRKQWKKYVEAIDDMFEKTSTDFAPWHGIASEHKWFGRVQVLECTTQWLGKYFGIDLTLPKEWKMHGD